MTEIKNKLLISLTLLAGIFICFSSPLSGRINDNNLNLPENFDAAPDSSFLLQVNKNFICIDFVSPSVFRVRMNNQKIFPEGGMERYGIVNIKYQHHKVKRNIKGDNIEFSTDFAKIIINKKDGRLSLFDKNGNILTRNDEPPQSDMDKGFRLSFKLTPDERLYGFGDVSRGQVQRRGIQSDVLVTNRTAYIPIPFVMSDHNWGLFLNTTMYHSFDAGDTNKGQLSFNSAKGTLDYFLIAGESMADILDKYTDITGKPHLLPKWGYGLIWVCDERGVRARDVLYEAYEFRRHGIPCDVIGLEPDWMEKHYDTSTKKQWSQERFHIPFWLRPGSPSTFPGALKNMGFKLSLWLCTNYDFSEYEEWQLQQGKSDKKNIFDDKKRGPARDLQEEDLILDPNLGDIMPDKSAQQPEPKDQIEPWFEHLKKFVDDGASMFKLDGAGQVTLKITPDRKWKNGMDDYEMINLYPLLYSKQMSLGFKEYTGRRAMIFTAGGYAGIQRYSATWSGDTGGGKGPMISLINHGLSGHSNVCTDMDVHTEAGIHFGFFQPFSQVLGWQMYVEPWFLGEKRAAMFKDYAILRYKLIPYIYSMAHLASEKATPIMRAMSLAYQNDPKCDEFMNQYMFGDEFLVSAFQETLYLPEGEWIDYWTGEKRQGNQEIKAEFPSDKGGPLFVKAGAIIPTQALKNYIGTETPEEIIWEIYPKSLSNFTLYEDDGESYKYLEGNIAKTHLECLENEEGILITIHPRIGKYDNMPENRTHSFKIISPGKYTLMNKTYPVHFDMSANMIKIEDVKETGQKIEIFLRRDK